MNDGLWDGSGEPSYMLDEPIFLAVTKHPFLAKSRVADTPTSMPWFGKNTLHLRFD